MTFDHKSAAALVRLEHEAELRIRIRFRQSNESRIAELQRILEAA